MDTMDAALGGFFGSIVAGAVGPLIAGGIAHSVGAQLPPEAFLKVALGSGGAVLGGFGVAMFSEEIKESYKKKKDALVKFIDQGKVKSKPEVTREISK